MQAPRTAEVFLFGVRHHSPACAFALLRALEDLRPAQVLVEGPEDFQPLIGPLTDPRARPPLAIVSLPQAGGEGQPATYPFCRHSPEYVALVWARAAGARATFIDLPAGHAAMGAAGGGAAPAPALLDGWRLDHNAYVAELSARRGVRDGGALWDALFEAHGGEVDWRAFFAAVRTYCGHIRAVTPDEEMARDGTNQREAHMAARLLGAIEGAEGPIAVVTGGFHLQALETALAGGVESRSGPGGGEGVAPAGRSAFLVRYGFRQLDRASGYGAGLPHPGWYDRLWSVLGSSEALEALSLSVLTDFAEDLRRTAPALALATPTLAAAALAARRLADLRGLAWPGRMEILDAVRSTAVKDAIEVGHTPLLAALDGFLAGDRLGDLPPGVSQPPIIDGVRAQARALGFSVESGARKTRDLDVLRRPRHARASRFLHALEFVQAGLARRLAGPDPVSGWREDSLFETWTYAWSPMVEQALIARAADGETLEALCQAEFQRRRTRLAEQGRGRDAEAAAALLLAAVRAGFPPMIAQAIEDCASAVAEDSEVRSIIRALALAASLSTGVEPALDSAFVGLRRRGFRRLMELIPHLAGAPPDRVTALAPALAELASLVDQHEEPGLSEALGEAVLAVLERGAPAALTGALTAFAALIGVIDPTVAAARLAAAMDGAYTGPGERAAALTGALTVSPRLLLASPELLACVDGFLASLDVEAFLAMLPELRLAFNLLSPSEIDRVAGWVGQRHGLTVQAVLYPAADQAETADNLAFAHMLEARWRADGLGDWLGAAL